MLLIDGVTFSEWTDLKEDELEAIVVEHARDLFGEQTEYFNVKKQVEACFDRNRIPDGYVIDFKNLQWHIVEVGLSAHSVDQHIREQVNDFIFAGSKESPSKLGGIWG
jgi:hypothetical protein